MLYSPRVMSRGVNITFYQRTLLRTSANQRRHYLKSYNYLVCHTQERVTIRLSVILSLVKMSPCKPMKTQDFHVNLHTLNIFYCHINVWIGHKFHNLETSSPSVNLHKI